MNVLVKDNSRIREVLSILMDSPLYLELSLAERYELLLQTLHKL